MSRPVPASSSPSTSKAASPLPAAVHSAPPSSGPSPPVARDRQPSDPKLQGLAAGRAPPEASASPTPPNGSLFSRWRKEIHFAPPSRDPSPLREQAASTNDPAANRLVQLNLALEAWNSFLTADHSDMTPRQRQDAESQLKATVQQCIAKKFDNLQDASSFLTDAYTILNTKPALKEVYMPDIIRAYCRHAREGGTYELTAQFLNEAWKLCKELSPNDLIPACASIIGACTTAGTKAQNVADATRFGEWAVTHTKSVDTAIRNPPISHEATAATARSEKLHHQVCSAVVDAMTEGEKNNSPNSEASRALVAQFKNEELGTRYTSTIIAAYIKRGTSAQNYAEGLEYLKEAHTLANAAREASRSNSPERTGFEALQNQATLTMQEIGNKIGQISSESRRHFMEAANHERRANGEPLHKDLVLKSRTWKDKLADHLPDLPKPKKKSGDSLEDMIAGYDAGLSLPSSDVAPQQYDSEMTQEYMQKARAAKAQPKPPTFADKFRLRKPKEESEPLETIELEDLEARKAGLDFEKEALIQQQEDISIVIDNPLTARSLHKEKEKELARVTSKLSELANIESELAAREQARGQALEHFKLVLSELERAKEVNPKSLKHISLDTTIDSQLINNLNTEAQQVRAKIREISVQIFTNMIKKAQKPETGPPEAARLFREAKRFAIQEKLNEPVFGVNEDVDVTLNKQELNRNCLLDLAAACVKKGLEQLKGPHNAEAMKNNYLINMGYQLLKDGLLSEEDYVQAVSPSVDQYIWQGAHSLEATALLIHKTGLEKVYLGRNSPLIKKYLDIAQADIPKENAVGLSAADIAARIEAIKRALKLLEGLVDEAAKKATGPEKTVILGHYDAIAGVYNAASRKFGTKPKIGKIKKHPDLRTEDKAIQQKKKNAEMKKPEEGKR